MTYLPIYLIGCVIAYPLLKKDFIHDGIEWTVGVRNTVFIFCIGSWIVVAITIASLMSNSDRPAKW